MNKIKTDVQWTQHGGSHEHTILGIDILIERKINVAIKPLLTKINILEEKNRKMERKFEQIVLNKMKK